MSEGPYRDLGYGFARLTGVEGVRRAPSRIETVEDALLELLRNSADAGAENIYVATALHARRYRELVILDDGCGIPEAYLEMVFEPGVTTRHLTPSRIAERTHGAGLSLHHIRESSVSANVVSSKTPTSIRAVFDTETLPEHSLQSAPNPRRASRSNLRATLEAFVAAPGAPEIFYGSPAGILALLSNDRIIPREVRELELWSEERMGVELSRRTIQRVVKGSVSPAEKVREAGRSDEQRGEEGRKREGFTSEGVRLTLSERDLAEIRSVIERAAEESYLEVGELGFESGEGEVMVRARIYEAEEEYDE